MLHDNLVVPTPNYFFHKINDDIVKPEEEEHEVCEGVH